MTDLIKTVIDIYGRVGDFRITPYDGALPMSEADRLAREAVAQHDKAVAEAERDRIVAFLNCCGGELANKYADWIEAGDHLK